MSKMESGLYQLLSELLKAADHPLTCVELYERADVRALAHSANRVSDYLGGLWRKGHATRVAAAKNARDSSRWAYVWREPGPAPVHGAGATPQVYGARTTLVDKPNILITSEHDVITIELPGFAITVRQRPG
jgi:hypothetical protein